MSVSTNRAGWREVSVEVEVPGTPEVVWQAIATGPGITSWFVPTTVEEHVGGAVNANFGPGMESVSTITAWEPPHRFTATSHDLGPGTPPIATEWTVEARAGGTCIVRVAHSLFTESDEWDSALEAWEHGWPDFFRILRLYLTNFAGQQGTLVPVMGAGSDPDQLVAWQGLLTALGVGEIDLGKPVTTSGDAPALAGSIEQVLMGDVANELLLKLTAPAPGLAHLFAMPMEGQVLLSLRLYLYGAEGASAAAREEPKWQVWMAERFPFAVV